MIGTCFACKKCWTRLSNSLERPEMAAPSKTPHPQIPFTQRMVKGGRMSNERSTAVFIGLAILVALVVGCMQDSQTTAPSTSSLNGSTSNALAVNVWQSELTLLKSAGYDVGNSSGIFSL